MQKVDRIAYIYKGVIYTQISLHFTKTVYFPKITPIGTIPMPSGIYATNKRYLEDLTSQYTTYSNQWVFESIEKGVPFSFVFYDQTNNQWLQYVVTKKMKTPVDRDLIIEYPGIARNIATISRLERIYMESKTVSPY